MTINNSLKIKIIYDYMSGIKREDIAKKYEIGTGSISAIAEEFETDIPDILKLRAMMVRLNAAGNDPKVFYHAIRLHNYIENQGLSEEKAEYIIEIFQEYAFKKNYDVSELIDSVINAYYIAKRCRSDLEHLESDTNAKKMTKEGLEARIRKLKNEIEFLPHKLNINLAEFQEYQTNRPTFQAFMNLTNELDIQARKTKLLEDDNKKLKSEKHDLEIENDRLNQLLAKQTKEEDEYYTGCQQYIGEFDSSDHPVDDFQAP